MLLLVVVFWLKLQCRLFDNLTMHGQISGRLVVYVLPQVSHHGAHVVMCVNARPIQAIDDMRTAAAWQNSSKGQLHGRIVAE